MRHGVVAAARVPADTASEDHGGAVGGRDGGERSDGHASPPGCGRADGRTGAVADGRRWGAKGPVQRWRLIALQTRCRSMWRREVSRGAHNGVRHVRPVPVARRVIIPYPFTRIPLPGVSIRLRGTSRGRPRLGLRADGGSGGEWARGGPPGAGGLLRERNM
ncbi:hypothetical protein GCM10010521_41210 [Streptomyces rameus]|uniref:Uncharacterized protein n=1 Tax=Streptomyces rameus TaxID=68261 RepID=A0ABP6NIG4_9ACTN